MAAFCVVFEPTGLFSDWADFTLEGQINIYDMTCQTGLVRGIGMYTSSKLRFVDAKLSIHDLVAGVALNDVDTDSLPWPYNPAIAKPFHVIWSETMEDFPDKEWDSTVVGAVDASLQCVVGRDGVDDSDFPVTSIVNDGCFDDEEGTFEAYQRMIEADEFRSSRALSPGSSLSTGMGSYQRQLVWALSAVVALFIIGSMVYLWERKTQRTVSPKLLQRERKGMESESQPLIAQHFDALRYL